jgi:PAS domain S-box-containing protein
VKPSKLEHPVRITLLYLLFGGLWIILSDQILYLFIFHDARETMYQTYKGWFFVLISGILLYFLLRMDLSGRKRAEEALRNSQAQVASIFNSAMDAIITVDADQRIVIFNPAAEAIFQCSQAEALGQSLERFIPQRFRSQHSEYMKKFQETGATKRAMSHLGTIYGLRSDGQEFPIEASISKTNITGGPLFMVILRDITKRKRAEQQSLQLKRLYATLSQVNQTIMRVRNQQELFESICRVAVEFGEFRLAWIGLYDEEICQVTPVAEYGATGNKLPFQKINIKDSPFKAGLLGLSGQTELVQVSSDIQADPRMAHWQEIAVRDGYHSAATVPIRQSGQITAFLNLYATDIGFFTVKEEQVLLEEMGLDISFALDVIEKAVERKRAEEEIQSRSRQLAALLKASQSLTGSLNLAEVLQRITDQSTDILGIETSAIYLAEEEQLSLSASTPPFPPNVSVAFRKAAMTEHPHIAQAITSGQLIILPDAAYATWTPAEQAIVNTLGLKTILYIPLAAKKRAEGVLILGTREKPREFSKDEQDLARTLSNQAALAIANAKLYEDLARYVKELENQISERRQAEESLRNSEARLRLSLQAANQGLYDLNVQTGHAMVNREYAQMLGYDPETFVETNAAWIERLHPEDRERVAAVYSDYVGGLLPEYRVEFRQRTKDGNWKWVLSLGKVIEHDPEGKPLRMLGTHTDITDRKQAEENLRRHINYLTGLREVDQAIASSFDVRLSLSILTARAIPLLKADAATILLLDPVMNVLEYGAGHGFWTKIPAGTSIRLTESYAGRAVIERHIVQIPNLSFEPSNFFGFGFLREEKFVSYYGVPLIVKGKVVGVMEVFNRTFVDREQEWFDFLDSLAGQAAIAIDNARLWDQVQRHARDLELRVSQRTAALNRTNAELEHANRAKDEFLANMSHELRTPLNSILGLSESLLEQRRDPLTDEQQRSLEIISTSGHHLLDLINDILDLSKIEAGKFDYFPQIVDVDTLCRSSLSFVRSQAVRKSITINCINEVSNLTMWADPRRLKQILVNLLTNAVKFTSEHGQVTLRVRADAEQGVIQFSILDNGIGIAPQDLRRLFQPFVQLDSRLNRQYEGTGLGLALVQKLTDMHGGSVAVESEVGVGSCFSVNLPWHPEEQSPQEPGALASNLPITSASRGSPLPSTKPLSQGVILLAEDNTLNILTIAEYLESYGYKVVKAHDGLEAIEKAEANDPSLILMDIQMPVMDGLEAIRRLRLISRFVATPVIAVTALAMPGDRERCLEAGANEFLSKPVHLKQLLKTIHQLL